MSKLSAAIGQWFKEGETGLSSETMAAVALGAKPRSKDYPLDPADLNRCLKLVKAVPGVRKVFPEIRRLNKRWAAVIDHWDELEAMFVSEVGWDWSAGRRAEKTYSRMKELGL